LKTAMGFAPMTRDCPNLNSFPKSITETSFRGLVGLAVRDITPPVGIYSRQWGAAIHDVAMGIHRPLQLNVLVLRENSGESEPLVLITVDACVIRHTEYAMLKAAAQRASGITDDARIIIQATHTHSGCPLSPENREQPGGHLIDDHLAKVCQQLEAAVNEALERTEVADICWRAGDCGLAGNRELPEPGAPAGRYTCGYNPDIAADTTLTVGRITARSDGRVVGVLAHYACHPTTLAWENRLLSSDWMGAARETVADACGGAPLMLLQGASGDQAPRRQYSGDTALADANGREVAYSILSILSGILPPGVRYRFDRTVSSGADLGVWKTESCEVPENLAAERTCVDLPLKPYESLESLHQQLAECKEKSIAERLRRQILRVKSLGGGESYPSPLTLWQVGSSVWVAQPEEAYACYQQSLRSAWPERIVLPLNLAGSPTLSYLYPEELADDYRYPVWVSTFKPEAYPRVLRHTLERLESFLNS
jgi:hypothetical protein